MLGDSGEDFEGDSAHNLTPPSPPRFMTVWPRPLYPRGSGTYSALFQHTCWHI